MLFWARPLGRQELFETQVVPSKYTFRSGVKLEFDGLVFEGGHISIRLMIFQCDGDHDNGHHDCHEGGNNGLGLCVMFVDSTRQTQQ